MSIWNERLPGARVLDLFAGSGAMGIEAVSRGAASVVFVESDRRALAALRRNLSLVPASSCSVEAVAAEQALERLRRRRAAFDLLFADPPYDLVPTAALFAALAEVVARGARLAFEHRATGRALDCGATWRETGRKTYGDAALSLFEIAAPGE